MSTTIAIQRLAYAVALALVVLAASRRLECGGKRVRCLHEARAGVPDRRGVPGADDPQPGPESQVRARRLTGALFPA